MFHWTLPFPTVLLPSFFHLTCVLSSRHMLGVLSSHSLGFVICNDKDYWSMSKVIWDLLGLNTRHVCSGFILTSDACVPPFFSSLDGTHDLELNTDLPVSVCQVMELKTYHHTWPLVFFFLLNSTMFLFDCFFVLFVCTLDWPLTFCDPPASASWLLWLWP